MNEIIDHIKTGRILTMNVGRIPYAVLCEIMFASRFLFHYMARL